MVSTEKTMHYMILLNTNSQKKKKGKAKLPSQGFPGGKESSCKFLRCGRCGFSSWVRKIPWRRKQQLTPLFLPGKFHGQRSLVGYSPWGHKQSNTTEGLSTHTHTHTHTHTCAQGARAGLGLLAALLWRESSTCRGNEPWGMMIMFIFQIDICLHGSTHVETFSIVHCKYMQFAKCQYAIIKPGK